ncbi:MAG: hypothetical protein E4G91_08860 [Candidatus Zixiibacteriota bacterium]|nr:MAG: hypothetical protein E4G91_08860 [candidate division Zixibacteria bacterium]
MSYKGNGTLRVQNAAQIRPVKVQIDVNKRFAVIPGTDIFWNLAASAGRPAGSGIVLLTRSCAATQLPGRKRRRQPMNIV